MKLTGDKILTWAIALIVTIIFNLIFYFHKDVISRMDNIDDRIDSVIENAFDK